jgi:hypothetical protein
MEDTEYVDVGAEVSNGVIGGQTVQSGDRWRFLVGTALSVYQNAGGSNTNWSNFEQTKNWLGQPVIEVTVQSLPSSAICHVSLRLLSGKSVLLHMVKCYGKSSA